MTEITLTHEQLLQLADAASRFEEVEMFKLVQDNSNGIGPVIYLEFKHSTPSKGTTALVKFDITDVSTW
jgi:hypothetical protein